MVFHEITGEAIEKPSRPAPSTNASDAPKRRILDHLYGYGCPSSGRR
jgi:hypothetical protein